MPPAKRKPTPAAAAGTVEFLYSGVARIRGLSHVALHDVLIDRKGASAGLVVGFRHGLVDVLLFDDTFDPAEPLFASGRTFTCSTSTKLGGRVLDGFGGSRDLLPFVPGKELPAFREAPPIIARDPVARPLLTGIKFIDTLLPLGRGQRELIIGDRKLGKSTLAIDAVIHQRHADPAVRCVYAVCGKKRDFLRDLVATFADNGATELVTVVAATSDDSYAAQYLAPFVACTLAESMRDAGHDVLVIYDDLSGHAKAYRDINLILALAPGREMYPADIFSLHAGLLERAAQLSKANGGGSLTALPIVETQEGDITSFIPTNLISITDGQIYLERGLFDKGYQPAINAGLSVSRLGSQVQPPLLRDVTLGLRITLAQQKELQKLTQLETTLSDQTKQRIHRGDLVLELLKQRPHRPMPWEEQTLLFFLVEQGSFDDLPKERWAEFERYFLDLVRHRYKDILHAIRGGAFGTAEKKKLVKLLADFKEEFVTV